MNLENYKKLLEAHNWKYIQSSDPKIYEAGIIEHNLLLRLATTSSDFRRAYFAMKEKMLPSCGH